MDYEDIAKTIEFQKILSQVPEAERAKVEEALRQMAKDFKDKVLVPLETLLKR